MIDVWTWPTPNGHKVHIALEELGLPTGSSRSTSAPATSSSRNSWRSRPITASLPIVDPDGPGRQSRSPCSNPGAILIYLAEKTGTPDPGRSGGAPALPAVADVPDGRASGRCSANTTISPPMRRKSCPMRSSVHQRGAAACTACSRSASSEAMTLPGRDYSIADIADLPLGAQPASAQRGPDAIPAPQRWHDAIARRPAVQRGVEVLSENQRSGLDDREVAREHVRQVQFAAR